MEMERRALGTVELRIDEAEGAEPVIEGHAAVFGEWSEELGGAFRFRERVMPGAFRDSIVSDDIRALFNHDPSMVLGRNAAGTLDLKETQKGLLVRIKPPDTGWARDLLVSIRRGDVSQMSFGFVVQEDQWTQDGELAMRELRRVKLYDVSPVTFPAYPQTDVGVRAAEVSFERFDAERRAAVERQNALRRRKLDLLT